MSRTELSLHEARRIALAAQGFDHPRPRRVSAAHISRTIRQLGLVQLDFVNVLVPAHYQVLFSRLGAYPRPLLDVVVYRRGQFTEQWAHEASIVPVDTWPLLRHRMDNHRVRPYGFEQFIGRHRKWYEWTVEQVRERGPLAADDFPDMEGIPRRIPGAWWTVPRALLEAHFRRGTLAVAERRSNFARVYDLAERILPEPHLSRRVEREDAQRELLRIAARAHGVGTAADLADYFRMPVREARPRLAELAACGELREARVEGWHEPAYLHRDARLPAAIGARALLSPFDPVVRFRPRTLRLFGFDYRMEVFVPQAQRKWGVYVLPFLLGDRLVARVDLKADRPGSRLVIVAAYVEAGADPGAVTTPLAAELRTMAAWLGLETAVVARRRLFDRLLATVLKHSPG